MSKRKKAGLVGGMFCGLVLLVSVSAAAKQKDWGLGISVGHPTGVSFKKWFSSTGALVVDAGWPVTNGSNFQVQGSYKIHFNDWIRVRKDRMPVHFGLGAKFRFERDLIVGFRFPIGVSYVFRSHPIDVFLEAAPTLYFTPVSAFEFEWGLGARFYF